MTCVPEAVAKRQAHAGLTAHAVARMGSAPEDVAKRRAHAGLTAHVAAKVAHATADAARLKTRGRSPAAVAAGAAAGVKTPFSFSFCNYCIPLGILKMTGTFLLNDIFTITGAGLIVVGKVVDGVIRPGMGANLGSTTATVAKIESKHKLVQEAVAGDLVGMSLKGVDKNLLNGFKGRQIIFSEDTRAQVAAPPMAPAVTKSKGMFGIFSR